MRDPENLHKLYEYIEEPPKVYNTKELIPYTEYDWDLSDESIVTKFIEHIERTYIRSSFEYRKMIQYLKNYMDMNSCSYFLNVTNVESPKIKIEIHHEPFDLFTITKTVYNKRCKLFESLAEEDIALEVMYLHYCLLIGLIPICETVHSLVHNQYILIPLDKVLGNFRQFYNMYNEYMDQEIKDIYNKITSCGYDYYDDYKVLLQKKYIYADNEDNISNEELQEIIKNRLYEMTTEEYNNTFMNIKPQNVEQNKPIEVLEFNE